MDDELETNLELPGSSIDRNECENSSMENIDNANSSTHFLSNESLSTLQTSITNPFTVQLTEFLTSPKYCSEVSENMKHDEEKTNPYGSLENGFNNETSSDQNERDEGEFIPSNEMQINTASSLPMELLASIENNEENSVELFNTQSSSNNYSKQNDNLSVEYPSSSEINNEENQNQSETAVEMECTDMQDITNNHNFVNTEKNSRDSEDTLIVRNNSVEYETANNEEEPKEDDSVECKRSKEEVGRFIDIVKREMLKMAVKTDDKEYRINKCEIHLSCAKKDDKESDHEEDDVLLIKQDGIECSSESIRKFASEGYDSYNSKLKKELTSDVDIEYVSLDSPQAKSTASSEKSNNSAVIMHQNIILKKVKPSTKKNLPAEVAVSDPKEKTCKFMFQSIPTHLRETIVHSIKSFPRADPNSSLPMPFNIQTLIPFKETPTAKQNNGFIVITTDAVEQTQPIYYVDRDITLQELFGSNVFTVVSNSLPSRLPLHGTPLVAPGFIVSPPTSPNHVATLRMTQAEANSLAISPDACAPVTPPMLSPAGCSSMVSQAQGTATQQQTYRAVKSMPSETSPVIKKRGRPPGSSQKKQLHRTFQNDNCKRQLKNMIETVDHVVKKENTDVDQREHSVSFSKMMSSASDDLKVLKEVKPVNTMIDCDDCHKSYKPGTIHKCTIKKNNSVKTEDKNFECPVCERLFSRKAHLNNHMRSHKRFMNTTVKCEMCKERFKKGQEIRDHRAVYHPETVNACDQCDKRFQSQKLLDQHRKTHDEDFPEIVRCVYCSGSFELRHYQNIHVHECTDNPINCVTRTDGNFAVRMAKPVAIRSRPFIENENNSEGEDHYEHVEILDEYVEGLAESSGESDYKNVQLLKRKREYSNDSESELEEGELSKKVKLTGTAYRSVKSEESSNYLEEENIIQSDEDDSTEDDLIEDEFIEGNGIDYNNIEENEESYSQYQEAARNYFDVEEMMNDRFSAA